MTARGIVLEMTDPACLLPSRRRSDLELIEVSASAGARIGALYRAIWEPIGGGGRGAWSDEQWMAELNQPGMRAWVAQRAGADVGMAQIGWSGAGDAAFIVIGVVPAAQGEGIGGDLLTRLTRLMWQTPAANGEPTTRVWLWTIPGEHAHTITNYLARGFVRGPDID
jgi:GNAT superfamily N-acetyltransferase